MSHSEGGGGLFNQILSRNTFLSKTKQKRLEKAFFDGHRIGVISSWGGAGGQTCDIWSTSGIPLKTWGHNASFQLCGMEGQSHQMFFFVKRSITESFQPGIHQVPSNSTFFTPPESTFEIGSLWTPIVRQIWHLVLEDLWPIITIPSIHSNQHRALKTTSRELWWAMMDLYS